MPLRPIGPVPAKVMLVLDAPSDMDINLGSLLSKGGAADELATGLVAAQLSLATCRTITFLPSRPPARDMNNWFPEDKKSITSDHILLNGRYVHKDAEQWLNNLKQEVEFCQPQVIIAFGNTAMWALTGNWGITSWRGSILRATLPAAYVSEPPVVIPTHTPGMILARQEWRPMFRRDLQRAGDIAREPSRGIAPKYNFILRPDFSSVISVLDQLYRRLCEGPLKLGVDIETRAGHISCFSLAWSNRDAICIPLMCVERPSYWTQEQEVTILYASSMILQHENLVGVGQNFHYDIQWIQRHLLMTVRLVRDTMITHHTLFPSLQKSLDFMASLHCDWYVYWKEEGRGWDPSIPEEDYWRYNCLDSCYTYEIDEKLLAITKASGKQDIVDFQNQLFWPVLRSMNYGVRRDEAKRQEFAKILMEQIQDHEARLYDALGYEINISSPLQMQKLFYETLQLPVQFDRKSGSPTTGDEALRTLGEREPLAIPLTKTIRELRSLQKFLSSYVLAKVDIDGRLRCSFGIPGTGTFRFNSKKNPFGTGTNLQNTPTGEETEDLILPNVKKMMVPDPGMEMFDIDLSSADLRIVVWESGEDEMKAMLREGADPYTVIAQEFYHDPTITKKDPRRQTFKSFAHGTHYLGTAKGLAERLGLSVHQAEQTQAWYFSRFPRIKKWQERLKAQVASRRTVRNIFGYEYQFLERITSNTFNEAAAWIPQSTVACLINRAYVAIDSDPTLGRDVQILLQVHDSLTGQYPIELAEQCRRGIIEKASIALPYDDPLVIPVGIKYSTISWGDC